MSDELVTIATFRLAAKADMARALFEQEGIEAFVADVAADWLLGGAVGHIKLKVPADQVALANELLRKHPHVLDQGPAAADETAGELTRCLSCGAAMSESDDVCPQCGWSYKAAGADDEPA